MGNIATALSLTLWRSGDTLRTQESGDIDTVISISEVLTDAKKWEEHLIATHMRAISSYLNILKTDIRTLLDESNDRKNTLDEHIELLKTSYIRTSERALILSEQSRELQSILWEAQIQTANAKKAMEEWYKSFETTGIESTIESYVESKKTESQARVYLAYVERFQRAYGILQGQNKKILDTLINNRAALISQSVVVIPDSGSELLKKLNLVVSEADYKEANTEK